MINKNNIKEKVNSFVPYLATFYYVEIIYLMVFINFLYGKLFAVTAGVILSLLLTLHVIRLFNKRDINRKIQLYVMDFHFAYSLAFCINRVFSGSTLTSIDYAVMTFRFTTALVEIFAVLILTDIIIKKEYTD